MLKRIYLLILLFQVALIGNDNPVIARFGKYKITLDEFRIVYLDLIKKPDVFDSKELREQCLDDLIERKLLYEDAKENGIDKNELFKYKENAYKDKCLREAHFDKVIRPKIKIEEKDVEDSYIFTQEERRISHLFFERETQADSFYQMLIKGADFLSLAKLVFADTSLSNSGGDLGWVQWDQLEYDLGQAAFKLPLNQFSKPIKSSFGYHIIRVTDFKKKPMITRTEYELHKKKVRYLLEYLIGDKLAYEYIDSLVNNSNIKIYPKVLNTIAEKRKEIFKRKPSAADKMNTIQLNDNEIKMAETSLWDIRNDFLANVNGEDLTVGNFIEIISFIPYEALYKSLRATLNFAFRDFMIISEAKKLGLENSNQVRLKSENYIQSFVQLEARRKIVMSVSVSEQEIKKYFQKNKKIFKNSSLEQEKNYIREILLTKKKQDAVPDYLKKIMKGIKVKKNLSALHKYYDSVLNGSNQD